MPVPLQTAGSEHLALATTKSVTADRYKTELDELRAALTTRSHGTEQEGALQQPYPTTTATAATRTGGRQCSRSPPHHMLPQLLGESQPKQGGTPAAGPDARRPR